MLHGKEFTVVPYIGESGNIQAEVVTRRRETMKRKRQVFGIGPAHWSMSSQLKFGPGGQVYALHQLHRQGMFTLIATLSRDGEFDDHGRNRTRYVKPLVMARKDLRIEERRRRPSRDATHDGELVGSIERALTRRKKTRRVPCVLGSDYEKGALRIWRSAPWLEEAAANMDRGWLGSTGKSR